MTDFSRRFAQSCKYGILTLVAVAGAALGDSLLQSSSAIYIAFEPELFLLNWEVLIGAVAIAAVTGAYFDDPAQPNWISNSARSILLTMLLLAVFQVLRRPLNSAITIGPVVKWMMVLGVAATAQWVAWRAKEPSQWRAANAAAIVLLTAYALQPGMPAYLTSMLQTKQIAAAADIEPNPSTITRRTIVVVFDEWDQEIALREGFFETPVMRSLSRQSFMATSAMAAGKDTLHSVPSMLLGRHFGPIQKGGPGYLVSENGDQFDANTASLFTDLQRNGLSFEVVGFYHDYCRLARAARRCTAIPVSFFPGWKHSLARVVPRQELNNQAYLGFVQQWHGTYQLLRKRALDAARNTHNSVVWAHLNIPHPPAAIPGVKLGSLLNDYRSNLVEVTQFIEDLQQSIHSSKIPTSVVLLSDHWLRERELWGTIYERQHGPGSGKAGKSADQKVPFVIWFNHPTASGIKFDEPVDTTQMRKLVLELAYGKLQTPEDVATFFSKERAASPASRTDTVH